MTTDAYTRWSDYTHIYFVLRLDVSGRYCTQRSCKPKRTYPSACGSMECEQSKRWRHSLSLRTKTLNLGHSLRYIPLKCGSLSSSTYFSIVFRFFDVNVSRFARPLRFGIPFVRGGFPASDLLPLRPHFHCLQAFLSNVLAC